MLAITEKSSTMRQAPDRAHGRTLTESRRLLDGASASCIHNSRNPEPDSDMSVIYMQKTNKRLQASAKRNPSPDW
jgi:hypothetical protein